MNNGQLMVIFNSNVKLCWQSEYSFTQAGDKWSINYADSKKKVNVKQP